MWAVLRLIFCYHAHIGNIQIREGRHEQSEAANLDEKRLASADTLDQQRSPAAG